MEDGFTGRLLPAESAGDLLVALRLMDRKT